MRQFATASLTTVLFLAVASISFAEQLVSVDIPDNVKTEVLRRHPKAQNLEAINVFHFGQDLLEVTFKEEGSTEMLVELFKTNGKFFTNELLIDDLNAISSTAKESLAKNFAGYKLIKAELITNPNGVGEEYEIDLVVGGENWKVSINEKGDILEKYSALAH